MLGRGSLRITVLRHQNIKFTSTIRHNLSNEFEQQIHTNSLLELWQACVDDGLLLTKTREMGNQMEAEDGITPRHNYHPHKGLLQGFLWRVLP